MHKVKIWMPVLVGLIAGQLFAEGERPFKVVNTVRVGYSDNLYRNANDQGGTFVTDIIDLSFRAALSDRTDVTVKSQINILTDTGRNQMYPNLYVMLNHSVSPRLLFGLSEYFRSGDKSGGDVHIPNKNTRYNYFYNKVEGTADYVLTDKDRLQGSLDYTMMRNEKAIDNLDYTVVGGGVTWKRTLIPQRTFATLNLRQSRVSYDNGARDTATTNYITDQAYYDETDLSAGLSHAFNKNWQGSIGAGVSRVVRNFSDYQVSPSPVVYKGADATSFSPLFNAGLVYSPSPRTRLTGDFSLSHQPSDDNGFGGQDTAELRFGAQHDLTAKLMAKATASFANTKYDTQDSKTRSASNETVDRMNLDFRLTYKLNRIHFLEAGVSHREANYDTGNSDWSENRVDMGWRVELN